MLDVPGTHNIKKQGNGYQIQFWDRNKSYSDYANNLPEAIKNVTSF